MTEPILRATFMSRHPYALDDLLTRIVSSYVKPEFSTRPYIRMEILNCKNLEEVRALTLNYTSKRYNIVISKAAALFPYQILIEQGTLEEIFWKAKSSVSFNWFSSLLSKREHEFFQFLQDPDPLKRSLIYSFLLRFKGGVKFIKEQKLRLDVPVWLYLPPKYDYPVLNRSMKLFKWGVKIDPEKLAEIDKTAIVDCPALINPSKYFLRGQQFVIRNMIQLQAAIDQFCYINQFERLRNEKNSIVSDASLDVLANQFDFAPDFATRRNLTRIADFSDLKNQFFDALYEINPLKYNVYTQYATEQDLALLASNTKHFGKFFVRSRIQ